MSDALFTFPSPGLCKKVVESFFCLAKVLCGNHYIVYKLERSTKVNIQSYQILLNTTYKFIESVGSSEKMISDTKHDFYYLI